MNLNDKVVVITGAASGIGRALAQQLAKKGAQLAISDINFTGLEETAKSFPAGTKHKLYLLDMTKKDDVKAHVDQVINDFGRVEVVINNAGATIIGSIAHLSIEELEWQLNINLWGVIYGTKAFLPIFLKQRNGLIVNISSVFGLVAFPNQGAYNIAKFGVRALTECLWGELKGTGVKAMLVHPGGIKTNIDRMARRAALANEEEASFDAAANKMLTTTPDDCAADIIKGMEQDKIRIITGNKSSTMYWLARLLPNHYMGILTALGK